MTAWPPLKPQDHHVHVSLEKGGQMEFDVALIAAGRQSNVQGLGLEQVGVKLGERGLILVDENYQTNIPKYLCSGGCDRLPGLGFHLHGAGAGGSRPCL